MRSGRPAGAILRARGSAVILSALLGAQLAISTQVVAGEMAELRNWLDRMARAVEQLNYQGVFVYWHDDHLESMRIVHLVDETGEHERLVAMNGSKREVIRENDNVTCIFPDEESVVDERITQRLFPAIPSTQLGDLEDRYAFRLEGDDRVAGLKVRAISVDPLDEFRYGYRLWLEENTGMLLKSALVDKDGRPLEQIMFTSIKLGALIPREELEPDAAPGQFMQLASARPAPSASKPAWQAMDVPQGFRLSAHDRSISEQGAWMEHLVYSDGLASVSVYVEPVSAGGDYLEGLSRIGVANAFGRSFDDVQVTVVGEVPEATVQRMALSVGPTGISVSAQ